MTPGMVQCSNDQGWNPPATKPAAYGVYEIRSFVDGSVRYAQYRRPYGWCWSARTPKLALQIRSPGRQDMTWRTVARGGTAVVGPESCL